MSLGPRAGRRAALALLPLLPLLAASDCAGNCPDRHEYRVLLDEQRPDDAPPLTGIDTAAPSCGGLDALAPGVTLELRDVLQEGHPHCAIIANRLDSSVPLGVDLGATSAAGGLVSYSAAYEPRAGCPAYYELIVDDIRGTNGGGWILNRRVVSPDCPDVDCDDQWLVTLTVLD